MIFSHEHHKEFMKDLALGTKMVGVFSAGLLLVLAGISKIALTIILL